MTDHFNIFLRVDVQPGYFPSGGDPHAVSTYRREVTRAVIVAIVDGESFTDAKAVIIDTSLDVIESDDGYFQIRVRRLPTPYPFTWSHHWHAWWARLRRRT